ncbi:MAG: hypothetical protein JNL01_02440 [Bdellovibrionales bacterium]|nr:hypothetical protein [Bdellovibrionales bacterium]
MNIVQSTQRRLVATAAVALVSAQILMTAFAPKAQAGCLGYYRDARDLRAEKVDKGLKVTMYGGVVLFLFPGPYLLSGLLGSTVMGAGQVVTLALIVGKTAHTFIAPDTTFLNPYTRVYRVLEESYGSDTKYTKRYFKSIIKQLPNKGKAIVDIKKLLIQAEQTDAFCPMIASKGEPELSKMKEVRAYLRLYLGLTK